MSRLDNTSNYFCSGEDNETAKMRFDYCSGLSIKVAYTYGPQIVLIVTLLAITIFRKEMSCNRCYTEQEESRDRMERTGTTAVTCLESHSASAATSQEAVSRLSFDDLEAEYLLEEAGRYCSGTFNLLVTAMKALNKMIPKALANAMWETLSSWWVVAAEGHRLGEILDGADNWCVRSPHSPPRDVLVLSIVENAATHREDCPTLFPAAEGLPTDATVHILSFLHPKDVLALACVSHQVRYTVEDESSEISTALWKTLWYRDYAWIVESWDIGQEAVKRSFQMSGSDERVGVTFGDVLFTKLFYFRFGLSYLNYVLAGQCTPKRCLVGLGGHIYDLTDFLDQHPGSPETVIVHAGRDASAVFESTRHSVSARKLAQKLCVAVDMSQTGGTGVRPTTKLLKDWSSTATVDACSSSGLHLPSPGNNIMPNGRPRATIFATAATVRNDFINEQDDKQKQAARWLLRVTDAILGEIHAYYDPFCDKWKAWYISTQHIAVYVDDL